MVEANQNDRQRSLEYMLVVGKQRGSKGDQEMDKEVTGKTSRNEAASNIKESNSRNYVD